MILLDLAHINFDITQNREEFKTHLQYVRNLKYRLQRTYDLAMKSAAKVGEWNKTRFDKHVLESTLEIGSWSKTYV